MVAMRAIFREATAALPSVKSSTEPLVLGRIGLEPYFTVPAIGSADDRLATEAIQNIGVLGQRVKAKKLMLNFNES
jgi:hypothetical protein